MTAGARKGTLEGDRIPLRDAQGHRYWRGKVTLLDGTKVRVEIPDTKRYSQTAARDHVDFCQEQEDLHHTIYNAKVEGTAKREARVAGSVSETCDAWYERFKTFRKSEVSDIDEDAWRWSKWISPHIGAKPIRDVTADDVENIRDAITAAVIAYEAAGNVKGEGRLAPKTAQNVWAALTTPMKYSSTRKGPRELRVREDKGNPCHEIPPPRDGESKRRHWLRPVQSVKLLAWLAPRDRAWAEAYAIGLYLHLRPGELHELRVRDLDLEGGEVRVDRAYNERKKNVKAPKSAMGIRTISIPPTLLPLLQRIALERKADDRVCPIVASTPSKTLPTLYRDFLIAASIDAPAFFVETSTHLMIDFRSLRDSGITWRFLAGERSEVVQREAGHEHISTTLGYAKEVQDRQGRFGEPFPPLPAELIGGSDSQLSGPPCGPLEPQGVDIMVEAPGIETAEPPRSKPKEVISRLPDTSSAADATELSTRDAMARPSVDRDLDQRVSKAPIGDLQRLAAKARIVESMCSGDVRVLAEELRIALEALAGPSASVESLAARRTRNR